MMHQATKHDPLTTVPAPPLSVAELEEQLIAVDPGVVLAPSRILRRVIKSHRSNGSIGLLTPHRHCYVLRRDELFAVAGRRELSLPLERALPAFVILLPQPANGSLPREDVLRTYGRLLFHALVHRALQEWRLDGGLDDSAIRDRIRCLGDTEFAEAKAVLYDEHLLLAPGDDAQVYEELVATYLELRYFDPDKLPRYFPSLDGAAAERLFAGDVDAESMFCAVTPFLPEKEDAESGGHGDQRAGGQPAIAEPAADAQASLAAAKCAEEKGNLVRAALCMVRSGAESGGERAMGSLVERLQKALQFSAEDAVVWRRGLTALLKPAAAGLWPVEARLLYDLQKICIDHEQATYSADLVEWVVSWGKHPIKRLLPYQGDVHALKHLRIALRRLAVARIDATTRRELGQRLRDALHHGEGQLRQRLRPVIVRTLDKVDMAPADAVEMVTRDKLVEELLDLIVERGFLNLGDLRDAIARNRLKMPNLTGAREFFHGDRLIRLNRRFAESLDGVYRRGEIYLRWLQRLNSVAFGTRVGRFFTLYFALTFGSAYVLLGGVQFLLHDILRWTGVIKFDGLPSVAGAVGLTAVAAHGPRLHFLQWWSIGLLGGFFFGLLHSPPFRRGVLHTLKALLGAIRFLLVDLPAFVLRLPPVRAFLKSPSFQFCYQFLAKPLFYSALLALPLYAAGVSRAIVSFSAVAAFMATTLVLNSNFGQLLEETVGDFLVFGWYMLRDDVLPGLYRWIMSLFRRLLGDVERLIYTVDEWLRFRQGDSPTSFRVKVALGCVWFCITYVVRFAVNVVVEPQINPIKHFPVVTVSHKLVLAFLVPALAHVLSHTFNFEAALAGTIAFVIGLAPPGIAGFLVWELKENWKMYAANQSPTLDPDMVGAHGETVLRLLHRGFHSGTLPKLYAKLRRAQGRALRRQTEALHHVAESVRHFVERTLLATLAGSKCWEMGTAARVVSIDCGCKRIRVELACSPLSGETVLLDFEEYAGWLVAGFARRGWLAALNAEQDLALGTALAGFYKLAGVDLVREQVAALLPAAATLSVANEGLIVHLGDAAACYSLNGSETLEPAALRGELATVLPKLVRKDVLFSETELKWSDWIATWDGPLCQGAVSRLGVPKKIL